MFYYTCFISAAEPVWSDLISMKSWNGFGGKSIAGFIALHDLPICDNFASLLLNANHLVVSAIRKESQGNQLQFINTVLSKWHSREGTSVPCTWKNLIQCMKAAGLDQHMIQIIEQNI